MPPQSHQISWFARFEATNRNDKSGKYASQADITSNREKRSKYSHIRLGEKISIQVEMMGFSSNENNFSVNGA